MHIVATAVEPEFVHLNVERHDGKVVGGELTIDLARLQVTGLHHRSVGSVQLILMASDVETIKQALNG